MTATHVLDVRLANLLPARDLSPLLPGADAAALHDIRGDWAGWLTTGYGRASCVEAAEKMGERPGPDARFAGWQWVWNDYLTDQRSGHRSGGFATITYRSSRCRGCHGRGVSTRNVSRNFARTGSPYMCGDCQGSRRGGPTRQQARYATVPESPESSEMGED